MNKILYKAGKGGRIQQWECNVEGDELVTTYGTLDGKLQTKRTKCLPKNVGKANETSGNEQALLECFASYKDRINNKHYRETIEEAKGVVENCIVPMKILNYKDHKDKLKKGYYESAKVNGSRAMFKDGEVISKAGRKEVFKVEHLKDQVAQLSVDVDGEVYKHGWSLQRIQSARNKVNEDTPELELWVFDIPVKGVHFKDRVNMLKELAAEVNYKDLTYIKVLVPFQPNEWVVSDYVEDLLEDYVERGYEGVVLWNPEGLYEFGMRSNDVFKYKPRYDAEAKVVSVTKDKNGEGVLHLVACDKLDKVAFKCKMKVNRRDGKRHERDYRTMCGLTGKWITFSYEELSDEGIPTKPVGEIERNCDETGEPLE